ncbi:Zinc knuckle [Fusarium albosuccineum]|uniref:Zinc knuckle n=1 Tax=Fusarium albosuccineum TaxID=1237068 RepID=A0A8H4L0N5_9HYPO|nr:Zinc knuckle [Fusarium albosuccineum]
MKLYRDDTRSWLWWKTPKERFMAEMKVVIASLERGNLTTIEQLDRRAEEILEAIQRVINACVPTRLRYPAPKPQRYGAALRSAVQGREQPKASTNRQKEKKWGRYWTRRVEEAIYGKRRAKKLRWRHRVASQTQNGRGVYRMARLAKRMCQPKDKTRIPPLKSGGVTYTTEEEKGNCLRDTMWPETSDGDSAPPLPMPDFLANDEFSADQSLTEEEVDRLIKSLPTGKAAGYDGIANEALKMARVELVPILTEFFSACLALSHHPKSFKHAITAILPKDGKENYSDPKSWRPIALLPSLGKLLEKIVTNRLKKLAIDHNLLPASQYGAPGKSTSSAVHAILKRVYKAWSRRRKKQWKKAVTVMSLDISGAFNRVKRDILLKILVEKKVPTWLVKFVWSFLSDCTTVLKMPGSTTKSFFVNIGIPQGSPLSPILFLFFSAPILKQVAESKLASVSAYAYVDDTYLVVVSRNYRDNCTALEQIHERILEWSGPAGVTFSPPKYKIMHFKHPAEKGADSSKLPNIPGLQNIETCLKTKLNILGVIVDHRLTWDEHIKEIERKVAKQLRYLKRISNSVYGLSLKAARQIYVTKIRPTISYACQAWFIYTWSKTGGWRLSAENLQRLDKLQHTCLHAVSGSFRRCAKRVLEKELHIEPIHIFLYRTMMAQRAKLIKPKGHFPFVGDVDRPEPTLVAEAPPYERIDVEASVVCQRAWDRLSHGIEDDRLLPIAQWLDTKARNRAINRAAREQALEQCRAEWQKYLDERANRRLTRPQDYPFEKNKDPPAALVGGWGPGSLRYYRGLTRAQSSMLIQCRTEFIGLNAFLHKVNRAPTAACPCGYRSQTVFHLFVYCPILSPARALLRAQLQHTDFTRLMTEDGAVAADWAISFFTIPQFEWALPHSRFCQDPHQRDSS